MAVMMLTVGHCRTLLPWVNVDQLDPAQLEALREQILNAQQEHDGGDADGGVPGADE